MPAFFNFQCFFTSKFISGSFIKYDPAAGRTNPATNGFPSGVNFKDGSVQYAGFGSATSCVSDMNINPGYISTASGSAGAYTACSGGEKFDNSSAFYVAYHSDLQWVPVSGSLSSIPGQIVHNYNSYQLRYGRILVNGFYLLGK